MENPLSISETYNGVFSIKKSVVLRRTFKVFHQNETNERRKQTNKLKRNIIKTSDEPCCGRALIC